MKKNFIYLAITLLAGLFASCSQENDSSTPNSQNKLVNISAERICQNTCCSVSRRSLPALHS